MRLHCPHSEKLLGQLHIPGCAETPFWGLFHSKKTFWIKYHITEWVVYCMTKEYKL